MTILDTKGKSRAITIPPDVKQLWKQIQHILRDPVIRRYAFPDDIHLEKKAGITALCDYTLADNISQGEGQKINSFFVTP